MIQPALRRPGIGCAGRRDPECLSARARELARWAYLRYNRGMVQPHRLRLILVLAIVVVLAAAAVLWLRGVPGDTTSSSPLPPRAGDQGSPLPTPVPSESAPASLARAGAILLWVVLGGVLALGIALVILRRQHRGQRRRDV